MGNQAHKIANLCLGKPAFLVWLLFCLAGTASNAQVQRYEVKLAPFSTHMNDEFSPVFYRDGVVICSNLRDNSLAGYQDEQNRLFKLYYVSKGNQQKWQFPKLLARELTTGYNDGPVTFSADGTILYYSRNNSIEKSLRSITDPANKLGIYSSVNTNGIWSDIKPFAYNNPLFTLTTPALSINGQRLYFSSDMPGGMGGMDLYYCNWNANGWSEPVNLGPVVNSPGNESFPFADITGRLFFSSDGLPGLGGMDLFFTLEVNGAWIVPTHLDSSINSSADDFALTMDSTLRSGYFSSNRLKSDDIFSFTRAVEEFSNCDTVKEANYCFTFYDERHWLIDTLHALYKWDFGNGLIREGTEVKHCFPGPGEYPVMLDIIDEITGDTIAEQVAYHVELDPAEAYFHSNYLGVTGKPLTFDAQKILMKDVPVSAYWWDFGDGFEPGGSQMRYTYPEGGKYTVRLGLISAKDSAGNIHKACAVKEISIYDTFEELTVNQSTIKSKQDNGMQIACYLMDDLTDQQKQKIKVVFEKKDRFIGSDRYGVLPFPNPLLDEVAGMLQKDPEMKLEMVVHSNKNADQESALKASEKQAQELTFYIKNKGTSKHAFRGNGVGLSGSFVNSLLKQREQPEGIIEFVFMKR
ncbi:MAG: PKD domain-containing protein [Bacteroidales bacterium]